MKEMVSIEEVMEAEKELKDALELNSFDVLKKTFDVLFEERIVQVENEYRLRGMSEFSNDTIKKKLSGEFLDGLFGEKMGLTTMPKEQKVAMSILKIAHEMKKELCIDILKIISSLIPNLIQLMPDRKEEINEEFEKLFTKFAKLLFINEEVVTIFRENEEMMTPNFLQPTFENVQKKWKLNEVCDIEGCLPELENLYSGEEWERSRGLISVLKDMLWGMIEDCISFKKTIIKD